MTTEPNETIEDVEFNDHNYSRAYDASWKGDKLIPRNNVALCGFVDNNPPKELSPTPTRRCCPICLALFKHGGYSSL